MIPLEVLILKPLENLQIKRGSEVPGDRWMWMAEWKEGLFFPVHEETLKITEQQARMCNSQRIRGLEMVRRQDIICHDAQWILDSRRNEFNVLKNGCNDYIPCWKGWMSFSRCKPANQLVRRERNNEATKKLWRNNICITWTNNVRVICNCPLSTQFSSVT